MFNLVVLSGRLTATPVLETTQNGVSVCNFTIAVERRYKQGEERQTDFINIVAWRGTAEFVSKHFYKGSMIGIEGSIQTRKYQDKDGKNRTAFEIKANEAQFIESKRSQDAIEPQSQSNLDIFTEVETDDDLPF